MCAYHNNINYSYYYSVNYLKVRDTISVIIFICTIYIFFFFRFLLRTPSLPTICNIRTINFIPCYPRYGWRQVVYIVQLLRVSFSLLFFLVSFFSFHRSTRNTPLCPELYRSTLMISVSELFSVVMNNEICV